MMDVQVRALDERDVLALYRRYPGTAGPSRCLLSLDLAGGSFSAGPDEEPGVRVAGTVRQKPRHRRARRCCHRGRLARQEACIDLARAQPPAP